MEIVIPGTLCVAVSDASMVAEARRRVAVLSMETGFSETQAGRLAIVTTELATNLVKHADGGELYLVPTQTPAGPAIDLLAVDRGGGMSDVDACLRDGARGSLPSSSDSTSRSARASPRPSARSRGTPTATPAAEASTSRSKAKASLHSS